MKEIGAMWKTEKERRKAEGGEDRDYDFSSDSGEERGGQDDSFVLDESVLVIDVDVDVDEDLGGVFEQLKV